jgi:hypothetical protein
MDVQRSIARAQMSLDLDRGFRSNIFVFDRGHHNLYGFVGRSAKLSKQFAMVEEIRPQHFG